MIYQQLHKDCGGEIIIGVYEEKLILVCKDCNEKWFLPNGTRFVKPIDWISVNDEDGRLICPNTEL